MTNQEKKDLILKDIAKYNNELIRQAKIKINKKIAGDKSDPLELVSDVIFSIINRLDNTKTINKFYKMVKEDMLINYIGAAVDRNARFLNTPFGRKKLVIINRIQVSDLHHIPEEKEELPDHLQEKVNFLHKALEPEMAKEIFGNQWQLFTSLLGEYTEDPDCTYQKLSDKYGIPLGSISYVFKHMKTKLNEEYELWQRNP